MAKVHVVISRPRGEPQSLSTFYRTLASGLAAVPGLEVAIAPHLYDLAPQGPTLHYLRSVQTDLVVLAALYPRASYWLLDAHGIRGRLGVTSSLAQEETLEPSANARRPGSNILPRTLWCFDLRRYPDPEALVREILETVGPGLAPAPATAGSDTRSGPDTPPAWHEIVEPATPRWYPVIDFQECNDCLECLNFCLFGVYSVDAAGRPWVEQPDACRPGCPACARICPAGAILFPQHADPAIAGDPSAARKSLRLDLSQVLRGLSPADLAALERARALADIGPPAPLPPQAPTSSRPSEQTDTPAQSPPAVDLDSLVDQLDKLDD